MSFVTGSNYKINHNLSLGWVNFGFAGGGGSAGTGVQYKKTTFGVRIFSVPTSLEVTIEPNRKSTV